MNIGTLEIQLLANMGQLQRDMADAKSSVGGAMKEIEGYVNIAKTAFVALAGVASVGAFAGMIKNSIDATGALKDLSVQTGASEASLRQFQITGLTTDVSLGKITESMGKLSKNLFATSEDGKGAALAIKALGLDFDSFTKLSPEQQMLAVSKSMNTFEDGADKSAVAMALFGKQGATLLPFLKDLGDSADSITSKLSEQEIQLMKTQAALADAFGDNLTVIQKNSNEWKRDLATGLTPALYELSQAFLDVEAGGGGVGGTIAELARDGSITSWARTAVTGVTYVMDVFSGLGAVVTSTGLIIGNRLAAVSDNVTTAFDAIKQAATGDFSGAMKTMEAGVLRQQQLANDLAADLDRTWGEQTYGSKLRARMDDLAKTGLAAEDAKSKLDFRKTMEDNEKATAAAKEATKAHTAEMKAAAAEAKKNQDAIDKLNSSLDEKLAIGLLEATQTTKLTDAQKIEQKLIADLSEGIIEMTDAEYKNALAKIARLDAIQRQIELQKEEKKLQDDIAKDTAAIAEEVYKHTQALRADNDKLIEHNASILLTTQERQANTIATILNKAELLEMSAATRDDTGNLLENAGQLKEQARLLRERAGLISDGIGLEQIKKETVEWARFNENLGKGLTDALWGAVKSGKDIWLTFRDYMVNTIIDGAIKNALSSVISNGLNSLISGITGIRIPGVSSGGNPVVSLLDKGVNAITGGSGGVSGAISSVGSTISSALGLSGGGTAAAGSTAFGGSVATSTAVTGGSSIVATDLGLLGAGEAAAGGSAAAGSTAAASTTGSFLATAGPIAAAIATFAIMNSMNDKDGLNYWLSYDSTGKAGNVPDVPISQRLRYGENKGTMDSMAAEYISTAKALGITPEPGSFGYDAASDGTFNMGATFDGGHYRSGWVPNNSGTMEWARTRALFTALQASEKPKSIASLFDGLDAGLAPLDDLKGRLAQAAAAPKFAAGGFHSGGLRIVGEDGPELEATGPSRIFTAEQTAKIVGSASSGDGSNQALLNLMSMLLLEMRRVANAVNGQPDAPMPVESIA
jgi:hypothetical protein